MLHSFFILISLIVTSIVAQEFEPFRLPNNTIPEAYDISLRTWNFETSSTFTGSIRIGILAVESTNLITLHHNAQRIESLRVLSANEIPISIGDYSYNNFYELLTIPIVGSNLTQGMRYFIDIDYIGYMNMNNGFYRMWYFVDDTRVWFGSTQFQATFATLLYNFTIRITHEPSYTAISNMPAVSETMNSDGSVTTEFEESPPMSTYLVAFHISDFSHLTSLTPRPIPNRIFTEPGTINTSKLALEASGFLIKEFSNLFGIEYSLPKLDHVAIQGLPISAMENWGLTTHRPAIVLFNESLPAFDTRLSVIKTISHELSHQWFGNLVTPSWWSVVWLKEGFATFFEYLGVDLFCPDWKIWDYFVVDVNQDVFTSDAIISILPMTHNVRSPFEIEFRFKTITHKKGIAAAVLRMFWYMFGNETFIRGVTSYLKDNVYSDAGEEQLFDALDYSLRLDEENIIPPSVNVTTIMSTWTNQAGFPLITVDRNYDDKTERVTLRQDRYYASPWIRDQTTWWVPYNLVTPSNPGFENTRAEGWIPQHNSSWEITIDSLGANDFLLINKKSAGYYRAMYDNRNYRLISDAILRNRSHSYSTNIGNLFNDAFEFYRTDRISLTPILDLLRTLEFESEFVSWSPALPAIARINRIIRGHRNDGIWHDFIRSLIEKMYDTVGIESISDEPILKSYARRPIVQLACQVGSVHCRSDANRQLRRYMESGEDFDSLDFVMCPSLQSASRTEFHFVWNRLRSLPLSNVLQRSPIINWLGCSTSRSLLREYIRSSINSTNSNNVEYTEFEKSMVFDTIVVNGGNIGINVVLAFLLENAVEAFQTHSVLSLILLSNFIANAVHIESFTIILNILYDAGLISQGTIDFTMGNVAYNVEWLNTEGEVVNSWLM